MDVKTSGESRRDEVDTRKDSELGDLRQQVGKLLAGLDDSHRTGLESQNRLQVQYELSSEHKLLHESH